MTEKDAFEYLFSSMRHMKIVSKLDNDNSLSTLRLIESIEITLERVVRLERENAALKVGLQ